jgi:hypothetical protein
MPYQDPSFKKFLDSLKENNHSLKKLTDTVNDIKASSRKPLETLTKAGQKNLGIQAFQLKTERNILADEDKLLKDDERAEDLLKAISTTLIEIRNSIKGGSGTSGSGKVSSAASSKDIEPIKGRLGNLHWTDRTFGEDVRTAVAGAKGLGNTIASGAKKSWNAAIQAVKSPGQAIKSAVGSAKDIGRNIASTAKAGWDEMKDIAATPASYDAERERFNAAFEKSDVAGSYKPRNEKGQFVKYKDEGKGRVAYNLTKENQDKIEAVHNSINAQKAQGFEANNADKAALEKLNTHLQHTDPRAVEAAKHATDERSLAAVNPEADNIESSGEKLNKEIADNNKTLGELLSVTKTQLDNVKAIRDAVVPSTPSDVKSKPTEQKAAEAAPVAAEEGSSLASTALDIGGDLLSKGGKGAGKAGKIGGKILGGIGKAAKFLGPAAAIAGAAYSGFEGYKNTGSNFDLKEGQEATTGQKVSSTLGGVASGLTFGLLDEKTASQGIHKMGSAVGDFFGGSKAVQPATSPAVGTAVGNTSVENSDLARNASGAGGSNMVVSNNVSTNNTTKYVPLKGAPRPETQGSALERYQNRISAF